MGKSSKADKVAAIVIVVILVIVGIAVFQPSQVPDPIREKISESADVIDQSIQSTIPRASDEQTKSQSCDPAYPSVCIRPYPPDLDCDEIEYSDFKVPGIDPHGFDSDKDGIGCES
ncbi:MAG: hypothetical protein ACE5RT_06030 [Nitrosopumilaceae archaeon]